jgi:adenylyl-sulfate reductase (glutathione)
MRVFVFRFSAPQIGSFRLSDRAVNFSQRRCSVRPVNAEPKRSDSVVPFAATIVAPGEFCTCA